MDGALRAFTQAEADDALLATVRTACREKLPERFEALDFSQGIEGLGGLAIWDKDLGYARDFAADNGTALPLNAVVHEAYKATRRRVDADEGHAAALIRYWMALNAADDRYE
jgi:3-hydroxyisobutyrate dehydrogenase-like beta-hydroxyacid dehydrogenase